MPAALRSPISLALPPNPLPSTPRPSSSFLWKVAFPDRKLAGDWDREAVYR